MTDGEPGPAAPRPHTHRRSLLIGLAVVLTAVLAAPLGWWLTVRREAAIRAEAGTTAQQKCRAAVLRQVSQRIGATGPLSMSDLEFADIFVVRTDHDGTVAASVEGDVQATGADGKKLTYRFECALSAYDAEGQTWGAMTMSM